MKNPLRKCPNCQVPLYKTSEKYHHQFINGSFNSKKGTLHCYDCIAKEKQYKPHKSIKCSRCDSAKDLIISNINGKEEVLCKTCGTFAKIFNH